MRQMNNKVKKQEAMRRLSNEYDTLQRNAKSRYNDRVYMNLPVTRLERTFFRIMAEKLGIDKTKLLRRIISKLTDSYPSLVEQAKLDIDEDVDTDR